MESRFLFWKYQTKKESSAYLLMRNIFSLHPQIYAGKPNYVVAEAPKATDVLFNFSPIIPSRRPGFYVMNDPVYQLEMLVRYSLITRSVGTPFRITTEKRIKRRVCIKSSSRYMKKKRHYYIFCSLRQYPSCPHHPSCLCSILRLFGLLRGCCPG